jgi:hypothetical protein
MKARHPIPPLFRSIAAQLLLGVLLVGFLWLQLAGTAHRYVHTDSNPTLTSQASIWTALVPTHEWDEPSDSKNASCQLFDLAASELALTQALPVIAAPVFAFEQGELQNITFNVLPTLGYEARAPPTLI